MEKKIDYFFTSLKLSTFYIAWKLLFTRKSLFSGSGPLSLLGLTLGVACLFVSMAVMSGFESTLKNTMSDVTGHIQIVERPRPQESWTDLQSQLKKIDSRIQTTTPFLYLEAIVASNGQISGVLIQGVHKDQYQKVLNLNDRVVEGKNTLSSENSHWPQAMMGKGIARKMNFKIGDVFKVVVPINDSLDPTVFKRQIGEFQLVGVLDMGKYDWNERAIIVDIEQAQKVALLGNRYSGLLLKLDDVDHARDSAYQLANHLGPQFLVRDWRDVNENLFDAVIIERVVIFFVVLIIVIVAAFNISSTLYVGVVQRNNDIAILKTLGVSKKQILKIFTLQGLFLGLSGFVLGNLLGLFLCRLFMWAQKYFHLIPGSVYKIENIVVEVRMLDISAIGAATVLICYVATLAPALKSSRLSVVEGLRYG